ncbi:Hypothetical protein, putative [Bodo saltans]|uniref:F-box domain-containing protein n=1 Tax=Bodo saltans TaxID=75058 RepID=A0A0S4JTF6_BODSA|nr:Hypothetical protein, putative [Bodo saltans]|eukprot:CUG93515.1 Hypothetical protein, putative [Bodo saltans]
MGVQGETSLLLAHGGERLQCSPTKRRGETASVMTSDLTVDITVGTHRLRRVIELPVTASRSRHVLIASGDISRCSSGAVSLTFLLLGGAGPTGKLHHQWDAAQLTLSIACDAHNTPVDVIVGSFQTFSSPNFPEILSNRPNESNCCCVRGHRVYAVHQSQKSLQFAVMDIHGGIVRRPSIPLPPAPWKPPFSMVSTTTDAQEKRTTFVIGGDGGENVLCVGIEGALLYYSRLVRTPVRYTSLRTVRSSLTAGLHLCFGSRSSWCISDGKYFGQLPVTANLSECCDDSVCITFAEGSIPIALSGASALVLDPAEMTLGLHNTTTSAVEQPKALLPVSRSHCRTTTPLLPQDVWCVVCSFVNDLSTLAGISRVCRWSNAATKHDKLWETLERKALALPAAFLRHSDWRRAHACRRLLGTSSTLVADSMRIYTSSFSDSASALATSSNGTFLLHDGSALKVAAIPQQRLMLCRVETISTAVSNVALAALSRDGRIAAVVVKQLGVDVVSLSLWIEGASGWKLRGGAVPLTCLPDCGFISQGSGTFLVVLVCTASGQCIAVGEEDNSASMIDAQLPQLDCIIRPQTDVCGLATVAYFRTSTNNVVMITGDPITKAVATDGLRCRRGRYTLYEASEHFDDLLLISPSMVSAVGTGSSSTWEVPEDEGVCVGAVFSGGRHTVAIATAHRKPLTSVFALRIIDMLTRTTLWTSPLPCCPRFLRRIPFTDALLMVSDEAVIAYFRIHGKTSQLQPVVVYARRATREGAASAGVVSSQLVRTHVGFSAFALCLWDGTVLRAIPLHVR